VLASKLLLKPAHGASNKIKKDSDSRCPARRKIDNQSRSGDRGHRSFLHVRGYCGRYVRFSWCLSASREKDNVPVLPRVETNRQSVFTRSFITFDCLIPANSF
jgi:hypothetical protein